MIGRLFMTLLSSDSCLQTTTSRQFAQQVAYRNRKVRRLTYPSDRIARGKISAIEPSNDDRCKPSGKQRVCFAYYDMGLNKVKICFCVESKVRKKHVYEIPQSFYPAYEMKSVVKSDRATEEMADKNYQVQRQLENKAADIHFGVEDLMKVSFLKLRRSYQPPARPTTTPQLACGASTSSQKTFRRGLEEGDLYPLQSNHLQTPQ